jgi:CheY-like chemotaxis protein
VEREFPILLVEDNRDDVFFVQRAFYTAQIKHPLFTVEDGEQAMEYLSGTGRYTDRTVYPMPRLILADLKMPRVNGFDLVAWIRKAPHCRFIPIVILSSSALPGDVNRAYIVGANAYMIKPADATSLQRLFQTIADFWVAGETVELPRAAGQ